MRVLDQCNPKRVFYYFEELCKIPHGSGNTKEISDYLVAFAREHHLTYHQDEKNNVIIYKAATEGYGHIASVILQGHMDMVCEKEQDSSHDFTKEGLDLFLEGDWIGARNTTLGGDDGIALAYILAILESEEYAHPALEAVFTVDEEIGLLGASALDYGRLHGQYMINLDSEEEGEFIISCAGGARSASTLPVQYQEGQGLCCQLNISGLKGGHSGAEIHKNRANADVLMGRVLYELCEELDLQVAELSGGSKETAIPRESSALLLIPLEDLDRTREIITGLEEDFRKEFLGIEEGLVVTLGKGEEDTQPVLHPVSLGKILFYLMNIPNGVMKYSGTIGNLVETSSNLGIIKLTNESFTAVSSTRSSVASAGNHVTSKIQFLTEFLGGEYHCGSRYPAWEYGGETKLQKLMVETYERMYQEQPQVKAIHAGLECGLFYHGLEGLECISIGPDMENIHTTMERLSVSSTERVFNYLLEVLSGMKQFPQA